MRSTVRKILAVALAAAMFVCIGAGCSKNDDKKDSSSSSATSSVSTDESKAEESKTEESKTEESKSEESKSEESKTESSEESAEESTAESSEEITEESSQESFEESTEGSQEESTEESTEESIEESSEEERIITAQDVVGSWEYNDGSAYTGLILNEDGTAVYRTVNGFSIDGDWEIENGAVAVRLMGGVQYFSFTDGKLVSDSDSEMLNVESLAIEDDTKNIIAQTAASGEWNCSTEQGVVTLQLDEDGTGVYKAGNTEFAVTWEAENNGIVIHVEGGVQRLLVSISPDEAIRFVDEETGLLFSQDA